ncbi:MAG TPA: acylphosphatase [Gammaproteobacteria bacterium]|jgi:acylphosphatase|nr:acylphosphatase [Gammaproteobacteria bacterium]
MKICIHCYVSGHVQGVWYRASAEEQALKLGLTGWAKNLPDGRVEVVACGEEEQVQQLYVWLKRGPVLAKVTAVTREELPWHDYHGFEVL